MKKCSGCKILKEYDDFFLWNKSKDGRYCYCRECYRKIRKTSRSIASQTKRAKSQKVKDYKKSYYSSDKWKKYFSEYMKEYRKRENSVIYTKEYRKSDIYKEYLSKPSVKLAARLRTRISNVINGKVKGGSSVRDLGCSVDQLVLYLENKFQIGMTWENWTKDGWHIDHITPLSKFDLTDREQFLKACHYTNLQPLWAKDNLSKGNR